MTLKSLALLAAILLTSNPLAAHDYTLGTLRIAHPMAFETAPHAQTGGGYLTITKEGPEADRLIGVRAAFARSELHQSVETDGIARMLPVEAIEIGPGETLALAPGGYHVMFIGLDGRRFVAGDKVPATLVFERAGEVAVEFAVEKRTGSSGGHDGHGSGHGDHSGHGAVAPSN